MIIVRINGEKKELPTSWSDVKFSQFVELSGGMTKEEAIRMFIGVDKKDRIDGLERIYKAVAFLDKEPAIDPAPLQLGSIRFKGDITFDTIEQFEEVRAEINRVKELPLKDQTLALATYAAIYCTDPYDSDHAKLLANEFLNYPCLEVMAAGSFFQAKCLSMQSGLSMNYLRKNILLRKSRPAFDRLMRRLAFTLHLTPSRDM